MFDYEKYIQKMEEAEKRYEIANAFKEPDRIPIRISVAGSYLSKLFGYNIKDYYTNLEIQIEVQLKGLQWCFEELHDDRTIYDGLHLDLGPILEGIVFDCEIVYPDDTSPRIVPKLYTSDDIEKLEIPDPTVHSKIQEIYKLGEKFKKLANQICPKIPVSFGGVGIHPPLSAACAIMEPTLVYTYMATEPNLTKKLFDKMLETFFKLRNYNDKYFGIKTVSIGLADDNSAFISNKMYREILLPYNMAIYERYGKKGRYLHADGPNDHHFQMYADIIKLTEMDIGGFSSNEEAAKWLKGKVVISGGLNCKDLYSDFHNAKPAIDKAIELLAFGGGYIFGVGGETYVKVNPDTLIKAVAYAKEKGKYPIKNIKGGVKI